LDEWRNLDNLIDSRTIHLNQGSNGEMSETSVVASDGSGRDFVDHWNWAATKGLLNSNTASALRAAVARVLAIEGESWESLDVRSLDVDRLLARFENLAKKDFTPESLATYRSRFIRAHRLYLSYLDDPRNYRPQTKERGPTDRSKARSGRDGTKASPTDAEAAVKGRADRAQAGVEMIRYPFPIRSGVMAELVLPADLKRDEARRLAAFLDSLAMDSPRMLPPHGGQSEPQAS
jgi:hypothetical protein